MARTLPPRFVDINTAKSSQGYMNVIGAVVDVLPKTLSGGSSFMITFTLKDSELDRYPGEGLQIKYFNNDEDALPDVRLRDVLLLRNIRIRQHRGALVGTASQYDRVPWAIFRRDDRGSHANAPICSTNPVQLTVEEKTYANSLLNQTDSIRVQSNSKEGQVESLEVPRPAMNKSMKVTRFDRFRLIKDIEPNKFADLVVHVVKTFPERNYFKLEVTDYTANEGLFNHVPDSEDDSMDGPSYGYGYASRTKKKWRGPHGKMTLPIALWEPHGNWAHMNIKEGDMVLLTNVHIKKFREQLEAAMHPDKTFPSKVHITKMDGDDDDPRLMDLMKRRREYYKKLRADEEKSNRNLSEALNGHQGSKERNVDKRDKKRQKKQAEKQKHRPIEEGQREMATTIVARRTETNGQVKAKHPAVPARSIADILHNQTHNNSSPDGVKYRLPFQNVSYRALVRVVDFFPPQLEDFAISFNREYDQLSDSDSYDDRDDQDVNMLDIPLSQRQIVWDWRFCLLIEDAHPAPAGQSRDRLKLFVHGPDAVFLLGIDPIDLRKHPETLTLLKEKLTVLWGNLGELKDKHVLKGGTEPFNADGLTSLPFYCCVYEYGVKRSQLELDYEDGVASYETNPETFFGWERRFAMHGTTIQT